MSVNIYLPHVFVFSEDRANRQIANGFAQMLRSGPARQFQVMRELDGWRKVIEYFKESQIGKMGSHPTRHAILLIDGDNHEDRFGEEWTQLPETIRDRVYIIGALSSPEELKRDRMETFEQVGMALAKDCLEGTSSVWDHRLLRHNSTQVERLLGSVRPFLVG